MNAHPSPKIAPKFRTLSDIDKIGLIQELILRR